MAPSPKPVRNGPDSHLSLTLIFRFGNALADVPFDGSCLADVLHALCERFNSEAESVEARLAAQLLKTRSVCGEDGDYDAAHSDAVVFPVFSSPESHVTATPSTTNTTTSAGAVPELTLPAGMGDGASLQACPAALVAALPSPTSTTHTSAALPFDLIMPTTLPPSQLAHVLAIGTAVFNAANAPAVYTVMPNTPGMMPGIAPLSSTIVQSSQLSMQAVIAGSNDAKSTSLELQPISALSTFADVLQVIHHIGSDYDIVCCQLVMGVHRDDGGAASITADIDLSKVPLDAVVLKAIQVHNML